MRRFAESVRAAPRKAAPDRRDRAYVAWLQGWLNQLMRARLTVDGQIGRQTQAAVRAFQGRQGLPVDGVVGPRTERALIAAGASPPPRAGAATPRNPSPVSAVSPGAPTLIKSEHQPPATTLYVRIVLGDESPAQPMTGIFIPENYRPLPQVDLILYLPGHKGIIPRDPSVSIDRYWNRGQFPYWPLREAVNESGKNVILVAPTLGPRSQAGSLIQPGGFDAYLDRVMAALREHGPYKGARQAPSVGTITLACHSGGGVPMFLLASRSQRYASRIQECWGFDCLYNQNDPECWAKWARSHPDARLYIYYRGRKSTEANSTRLKRQRLPNVFVAGVTPFVERAQDGHFRVPITYWRQRLQEAHFLKKR